MFIFVYGLLKKRNEAIHYIKKLGLLREKEYVQIYTSFPF